MSNREMERQLSKMFSSSVDEDGGDCAKLAERVWRRQRRGTAYANAAIFCAALVGFGLSYYVIGVYGPELPDIDSHVRTISHNLFAQVHP